MAGDCVLEFGLGGGRITDSDKGSGEIDSASELSCARPGFRPITDAGWLGMVMDLCESLSVPETSFVGITLDIAPPLFRRALEMGDCLTRVAFATDRGPGFEILFLSFFAGSPVDPSNMSTSGSIGEVAAGLAGCRGFEVTALCELRCASSIGDVRGLKYAPGTVNSGGIWKLVSWGVTAGDTSGVNDI